MLKITAGEFKSRRLLTPPDESVSRPYSQIAREAVFNMLRGWFDGARVLDLFAGIGTMGLEAVSRGARQVVLFERDRSIFKLLQENIEALQCGDRALAVNADALSEAALIRAPKPVDVVFIDPPYAIMESETGKRRVFDQIGRCRALMAQPGFVVLRSPTDPSIVEMSVEGFDGPEVHRYGKGMWVLLFSPNED